MNETEVGMNETEVSLNETEVSFNETDVSFYEMEVSMIPRFLIGWAACQSKWHWPTLVPMWLCARHLYYLVGLLL